eukprot:TRINITY_DN7031_c0_g1_i1.p1 TRINITY_DN7031_c0_g1~~TRINITY_DN7031_c0_g1_i1.p1  ORF type:complete len:451 (-),score=122.92 TRINITY_DN7031_c0_g1_i1:27-1379(-)
MYKAPVDGKEHKTSLIFSITNKLGGLAEVLDILKHNDLDLSRIESRPSKTENFDYDFFVDIVAGSPEKVDGVIQKLKEKGYAANALNSNSRVQRSNSSVNVSIINGAKNQVVDWFPRKLSDLDSFSTNILECGADLNADHPGFTDEEYRKRRVYIAEVARQYKYGVPIPRIEYTESEIATWNAVYSNLTSLFPKHACKQFNYVFPLLEQNCGYGLNKIPQLEDISRFLQECTGFRLRPVQGLLSSRDFLNALAFRTFFATQYIRHPAVPLYTPEPDVCHELLGHVPLFADPDFADFSQEIGLASLGASDADIEKLSTCYWFSVEYGLCKEGNEVKAYGAGLLSSFGELQYAVGLDEKKPKIVDFDPFVAAETKYPITEYQPLYFCAPSFQIAKEKMIQFANRMNRPFSVRYNPLTQSVEIMDTKAKISKFLKDIQNQMESLSASINKLPE